MIAEDEWLVVIDRQRVFAESEWSTWACPDSSYHTTDEAFARLAKAFGDRVVYTRYVAPQPPQNLHAGKARHAHIEKHQVRRVVPQTLQAFFSAGGAIGRYAPQFKTSRQGVGEILLIVDDEDSGAGADAAHGAVSPCAVAAA